MSPKTFISYSWTSPGHQALVLGWANRLISDGVEVVLDQYDLREGHDKFVFMEKMVVDESVTHVLIFSDRRYAEKADARTAGVGTESQIISREVYDKVEQSKFIPIACELDSDGEPYLPTYLKSRIWIDFTSAEAVNDNWERLVRVLHGQPALEKPALGTPPAYLKSETTPSLVPSSSRLAALRQSIQGGKPVSRRLRSDFLAHVVEAVDALRIRERPEAAINGARVLEDCKKLVPIRNLVIDWVVLESDATPSEDFVEDLLEFLEKLNELKGRPVELNSWHESWFEAHALFAYETFLYIVAALLQNKSFATLNQVLGAKLLIPQSERYGDRRFTNFTTFHAGSSSLNEVLAAPGHRYNSPAAEMIKRHSDRRDIAFTALLEADALVMLYCTIWQSGFWFPQLLYYLPNSHVPTLFARAESKRHFRALATVLGVASGEQIRQLWEEGRAAMGVDQWRGFYFPTGVSVVLNLSRLDSE